MNQRRRPTGFDFEGHRVTLIAMRLRRLCGLVALILFSGFQLEALMPDQCDDRSGSSWTSTEGTSTAPTTDRHPVHACHCVHVHIAVRVAAVQLLIPGVDAMLSRPQMSARPTAPPHLPFRPPLV